MHVIGGSEWLDRQGSKCVRGASLLKLERKRWIPQRLEERVGIFAIEVAGFSVLDNHLHVLVYWDAKAPRHWSKEQVLRRWAHDRAAVQTSETQGGGLRV
jgi:hypothetical protein